ncbi:unnamed protein product, partial [Clonostachys rosea f. rosea IK726]
MGITAFLAGPLEIATGNSIFGGQAIAAGWLGVIAMTITCTIHVQDLRDMEGDAVAGKRTIPILMGEMNARLFVALGVTFWARIDVDIQYGRYQDKGWRSAVVSTVGSMASGSRPASIYEELEMG